MPRITKSQKHDKATCLRCTGTFDQPLGDVGAPAFNTATYITTRQRGIKAAGVVILVWFLLLSVGTVIIADSVLNLYRYLDGPAQSFVEEVR